MRPFILGLLSDHDLLQKTYDRSSLSCPLLFVGVDFLEYIKSTQGPEEVPHFVTIIGDHDQKRLVVARTHAFLQLPGVLRLTIHNINTRQPRKKDGVRPVVLTLHVVEGLLGGLEVLGVGERDAVVPVEVVVVSHETLDAGEVDHDVLELARQKKAGGHALAAGDGVAFGGARADDLEQLLRHADVLARVAVLAALAHQRHHRRLQDLLARVRRLEVFDQVLGFDHFVVVQLLDYQVVLRFLYLVDYRR